MTLLVFALLSLVYVWAGYPAILWFMHHIQKKEAEILTNKHGIKVSVVIAAHNEAQRLVDRIENIRASDFPMELIDVVIASDGSTDTSREICEQLNSIHGNIKFIDIQPQAGRAYAHNCALDVCDGEVLIFTDADTIFEVTTISRLLLPFTNSDVGFVSGIVNYTNVASTQISQSAGLYWKFENMLRVLEDRAHLFIFGSGACCAVRKSLYQTIPHTGDVDFTTPLDVALQGYRCVYREDACAWDTMPASPKNEFRARVRMTAKNLHGTVARWGVKGIVRHPIFTWVLLSHKIGRWLTPFFMIGVFLGSFLAIENPLALFLLYAQVFFYSMAFAGWLGIRIPFSGAIYSFCLANAGFFAGVIKAITGQVPSVYKPLRQQ